LAAWVHFKGRASLLWAGGGQLSASGVVIGVGMASVAAFRLQNRER
jgi:hypothetical protein